MRIFARSARGIGPAVVIAAAASLAIIASASAQEGPAVKRGMYLVQGTGCGDCHTPLKMGASGPEPDLARLLSGHPASLMMPPAPQLPPGPWAATASATFTAWAGPWGVSFTANLTPDRATGLGQWTAQTFVDTIRSGRIMGKGRQLLPPMPYPAMQNLTDDDLRAMFTYLATIPAIKNRVPEPVTPEAGGGR
jgi:mono/diheme cytochrome c family protein